MSALAGRVRFGVAVPPGPDAIALRAGKGWVAATARLDNRLELEGQMRIEPPRARGMTDAEILAAAVERWADSAVEWLQGDYAFAWWDAAGNRLLLARDFAGTRPLWFAREEGGARFGSVPEAERVPAGHVVTLYEQGTAARRWWRAEPRQLGLVGDVEHAEALHAQLQQAVRARVRGLSEVAVVEGPGVDAIAAAAAREGVRVRRVASLEEVGKGVVLTALLGGVTIAYAGAGAAGLVPLLSGRALKQRLTAFADLDLAEALAAPPGIDLRDPTADRKLVELCVSIPERQWVRGLSRRAFGA